MRTFIITKNGTARIMRTYALGPHGRAITPDVEGKIEEVTPAPDAAAEIARWHPKHQAQVTAVREISEEDVPTIHDTPSLIGVKDAWEDDGQKIVVNLEKAKTLHAGHMDRRRREMMRDLIEREQLGEDVSAEKAAVRAVDPAVECAGKNTVEELVATWPAALEMRTVSRSTRG